MELRFAADVWYWRGPAPFHFVSVPDEIAREIREVAELVTYGWGMIPADVTVGATTWYTALWPKDGGYIVPLKTAIREAEGIELYDTIQVTLAIGE